MRILDQELLHRQQPRRRGIGVSGAGASIAAIGLLITVSVIIGLQMRSGIGWPLDLVIGVVGGLIVASAATGICIGIMALLRRLPLIATGVLAGTFVGLVLVVPLASAYSFGSILLAIIPAVPLLVVTALLGGAIGFGLQRGFRRPMAIVWLACASFLTALTLFWVINPGQDMPLISSVSQSSARNTLAGVANPGVAGPYPIAYLTYGSGADQRRVEYGTGVDVPTPSVDGSAFTTGWDGLKGRLRTWYWGFGPEALPLNARVWYPEGDGPFPLVLIVHGNHRMFEYSDPGYAYLGEHLASRGFIAASIDQNFINGSLYGDIKGDNSVRGWHLLQHLSLWRDWSESLDHPLGGKVDMERIALIGHSRGGEAIVLANAYNNLSHYPEDANERFDFGFNIHSLIAIATVDGQFKPADRPAPIEGVNYLLITGVQDADVADLSGGRTYDRVQLAAGSEQFKAAVHIYGANHGQFNTVWGDKDLPSPFYWFLNKRPLLSGEVQRQITAVYVGAFLETTLHDDKQYIPLFRDHRVAAEWLPPNLYISQYQDANQRTVARFDEDLDLTTTTMPGGRIDGQNLADWREGALPTPYNDATNFGAYIAWDEASHGAASFTVTLPQGLADAWAIGPESHIILSLADGRKADPSSEPIDFTVALTYADGSTATLPLSQFGTLWPTQSVKRLKLGPLEGLIGGTPILVQRFELDLASFDERAGRPEQELQSIQFIFDVTPEGSLYIDEVAFAQPRLKSSDDVPDHNGAADEHDSAWYHATEALDIDFAASDEV